MTKKNLFKKIRSIFNENTYQFCVLKKKKSNLYLMKIQISFFQRKSYLFLYKERTKFLLKNIRSVLEQS